ncbi:MAG: hypothetical protein A4E73_02652 [Syntrophaceae bacterium PtaU1.Bin231]|nr:MAG: hypothetical protein A4E73_02652 [Syntrophaceae bacterium PtaU1.Bin231]
MPVAADGSSRAGHQDPPAFQVTADGILVQADFLPSQDILDRHFTDRLDGQLPVDQFADARHGPVAPAGALAGGDDAPHLFGLCRRRCNQDFVERLGEVIDIVDNAKHRHAVDHFPLLVLVIIQEADRPHPDVRVLLKLPDRLFSRITGPDDQEMTAGRGLLPQLPERRNVVGQDQPHRDSRPADEEQRQHPVDGEDGAGETFETEKEQDRQDDDDRREAGSLDDILQILHARVAPHAAVQVESIEGDQLERQDPGKRPADAVPGLIRYAYFIAQQVGQEVRRRHHDGVDQKHVIEVRVTQQILHRTVNRRRRSQASSSSRSFFAKQKRASDDPPAA